MHNGDEILDKHWLDEYMELKIAQIEKRNDSETRLTNIAKIPHDAKQKYSEMSTYRRELFVLDVRFLRQFYATRLVKFFTHNTGSHLKFHLQSSLLRIALTPRSNVIYFLVSFVFSFSFLILFPFVSFFVPL